MRENTPKTGFQMIKINVNFAKKVLFLTLQLPYKQ